MVMIDGNRDRLVAGYVPSVHLGFYILFLLAAVILSARAALNGDTTMARLIVVFGGGISIAAMIMFIESTEIVLDKAAGTVSLRGRSAFGRTTRSVALADLAGAVNDSPFTKDRGTSHRPALILRDGTVIQTRKVYISRRASYRIVNAVNGWLAGSA